MPRCLAAALFAAILFAAAAPPASAASFDCGRAFTALEKLVCSDRRLGELDERMARSYIKLLNAVSFSEKTDVRADQKAWLKRRDECDDDARCISREYRLRIKRIEQQSAAAGAARNKTPEPVVAATAEERQPDEPRTSGTKRIRTAAERAARPAPSGGSDSAPAQKSPGIFVKMLSKVAPNLIEGDSGAANDNPAPPPDASAAQERQTARRDEALQRSPDLFEPQVDLPKVSKPARRKVVTTTREPAASEPPDRAPVALAPPGQKTNKKVQSAAKEPDAGAPAVLLYTTPDVSTVIRLPDGQSPFDQLDAQGAFDEPPGPPLKVTPKSLPQPIKRAFDSRRFDAFDDPPNG